MDRKHDLRDTQDMMQEMAAARGEQMYWEGQESNIEDMLKHGQFTALQMMSFAIIAMERVRDIEAAGADSNHTLFKE